MSFVRVEVFPLLGMGSMSWAYDLRSAGHAGSRRMWHLCPDNTIVREDASACSSRACCELRSRMIRTLLAGGALCRSLAGVAAGILLHTEDGGASWTRIPLSNKLPGAPLRITALPGKGEAEMVTESGAIYATSNAAYTWKAAVQVRCCDQVLSTPPSRGP